MSGAREDRYGLAGEFAGADALFKAAMRAREAGYIKLDAFSPVPVHGLGTLLGAKPREVSAWVLSGGLAGCFGGFFMQWWSAVKDYPMNIGGRPLLSWPSFIPLCFELTILLGGLCGFLAVFVLNGLPQPYHPLFNVARFAGASQDRFFLAVEADDPRFDPVGTRKFLLDQGALEVHDVPA